MNIGIDLDDTIADTAKKFFKYGKKYNKKQNIKFKIKKDEWDFDKAFGWTEKNTKDFFELYLKELFENVKPKKNAVTIINKLKKDGHKITIITARNSKHLESTYEISKKWINKHKLNINKLIIDANDKAKICEENNIELFIDDSVYNCESVYTKAKIPVLIMNSRYNKNYKNENIKKVFTWKEIYNNLKTV